MKKILFLLLGLILLTSCSKEKSYSCTMTLEGDNEIENREYIVELENDKIVKYTLINTYKISDNSYYKEKCNELKNKSNNNEYISTNIECDDKEVTIKSKVEYDFSKVENNGEIKINNLSSYISDDFKFNIDEYLKQRKIEKYNCKQ